MIERALIAAALSILAVLAISEVGQRWHPLKLAADAIAAPSCQSEGWGDAACAADRT